MFSALMNAGSVGFEPDELVARASIYDQPPPVKARLDMRTHVDVGASLELAGRHMVELLNPDE